MIYYYIIGFLALSYVVSLLVIQYITCFDDDNKWHSILIIICMIIISPVIVTFSIFSYIKGKFYQVGDVVVFTKCKALPVKVKHGYGATGKIITKNTFDCHIDIQDRVILAPYFNVKFKSYKVYRLMLGVKE